MEEVEGEPGDSIYGADLGGKSDAEEGRNERRSAPES